MIPSNFLNKNKNLYQDEEPIREETDSYELTQHLNSCIDKSLSSPSWFSCLVETEYPDKCQWISFMNCVLAQCIHPILRDTEQRTSQNSKNTAENVHDTIWCHFMNNLRRNFSSYFKETFASSKSFVCHYILNKVNCGTDHTSLLR